MSKKMWLIWKDPKTRQRYKIAVLSENKNNYTFSYISDIKEAQKKGFDFFPGFDEINKKYSEKELFTNIKGRLPNKARPDYKKILESYGLDESSTDMQILEKTRGRLRTDDFEFVAPFKDDFIEFDVAGTRYQDDMKKCKDKLKVGDTLLLKPEKENKQDKNAILILYDEKINYKIGYVPRYYSGQLSKILKQDRNYCAKISKLNLEEQGNEVVTVEIEFESSQKGSLN